MADKAGIGMVRLHLADKVGTGEVRCGGIWQSWRGVVRQRMVWWGQADWAGSGGVRHGRSRLGLAVRDGRVTDYFGQAGFFQQGASMDYPNSGSLWPAKNRKSDKSPNVIGSIKMEVGLLQELIAGSTDGLVEIQLSGWTKEWQDKKYISLKGSGPFKKEVRESNDESDIPF
jgi:hypothetical protein